ncbi:MAG TPA: hypothetical protein VHT27_07115 [Solirubrobacteraceae bacterium]|jgi:cell wall assembly regulator SMI1|nr:hypothetical protein [Solirubrobacteraceae bacterium]
MPARELDDALLDALERRLGLLSIPVDVWTNPGLSEDEAQTTMAPLGLRLPEEALTWWGWRNGANDEGWSKVLPQWREFISLERAVTEYRQAREIALSVAPDHPHGDPNILWSPEWFPLDDQRGQLVMDCSVGPGEATPIRVHNWEAMDEENAQVEAASLGAVVELWCRAIDVGAWEWDATASRWWPHWDLLGEADRRSRAT